MISESKTVTIDRLEKKFLTLLVTVIFDRVFARTHCVAVSYSTYPVSYSESEKM